MRHTAFITLLALLLMNIMGVAHAAAAHADAGQGAAHMTAADGAAVPDSMADCSMGGHHHFCHWYAQRLYLNANTATAYVVPVSSSPAILPAVLAPPARPPRV